VGFKLQQHPGSKHGRAKNNQTGLAEAADVCSQCVETDCTCLPHPTLDHHHHQQEHTVGHAPRMTG